MTKNNSNDSIRNAIKDHFNKIRLDSAQAIRDHDWSTVGWNIALVLAIVLVAAALSAVALSLVWKVLGTLLGKIFAAPLALLVLGLSYKMNYGDSRKTPQLSPSAEDEHGFVCDATFLALRDMAEYIQNLTSPSRPSTIECPDEPYTIEDGYVIHNFLARVRGPIDLDQFKSDLQQTFRQKHRAQELNGFSRNLVEINGSYYCPLQILGKPQDFGDFIQISVVLATEKTVELTHARKLLNLDNIGRTRGPRGATLQNDDL